MSGENRRIGGWLLPVIVVMVGAYFLATGMRAGNLRAVQLKPVNWAGLGAMLAGLVCALMKKPKLKLVGVFVCAIGAFMVICL